MASYEEEISRLRKAAAKVTGDTWWSKYKFKLFGEWKKFYWFVALVAIAQSIFIGIVVYIILHFVAKFW